jgi:glycosyltransferase involved in cell wall biosynthesis
MRVSVVCPFYNEEAILDASVRSMMENLATLGEDWELIIVNDGSTDHSPDIALALERTNPRIRVLSYQTNRGRGFALRTGIADARGDIVVTTEIDGSWGHDIVHRLVAEFKKQPHVDIVIASPHLPEGGYVNVPLKRVLLSMLGNFVIRSGLTYNVTMNTGMTRGYRREVISSLPLDEEGKEIHLEIVNKALAFGYRIHEIPAVLEWKDHKRTSGSPKRRKSSSKVNKLIRTHLLFSLAAAPFRFIYTVAGVLFLLSTAFFVWAFVYLFMPYPSIYLFLASLLIGLFAFVTLGIGVLAQQGRALQREMWHVRRLIREIRTKDKKT